jgi:spore coat protein CotH
MGGGRFPGGNGGAMPQDFQPPAGMQLPEGMQPPAGMGGRGMGGNKLKERFLVSTAFKTTYDDAYRNLYKKIYAGANALNTLDSITKVLGTVKGNNPDKTNSDAEQLRNLIIQRTQHLAGDSIITGG